MKQMLSFRYLNVMIPTQEHASKIVNLCSAARIVAGAAGGPLMPRVNTVSAMKQQV